MELSVIINCKADWRVFECIQSIDEDVEVIVVLVPNLELEAALCERGIRFIHTKPGNYSLNCNLGITAASNDRIIIMDSDCVFTPGCLRRLARLLEDYPLARARIKFLSSNSMLLSETIGRSRSAINNRIPIRAYTPGLGLQRKIVEQALNGTFFDERVFWAGDSEFSRRVSTSGLRIAYDPVAEVIHAPISITHEIRSAYLLGQGSRIQTYYKLRYNYEKISDLLQKLRPKNIIRSIWNSYRIAGPGGPFVVLLWNIGFYVGYFRYRGDDLYE